MTIGEVDKAIESLPSWILSEASKPGGACIPLHDAEYRAIVGELAEYWIGQEPYNDIGKWQWRIKRVDQLRNLYLYRRTD